MVMTADDARLEDAARRLLADSRFVARAVAAELGADAGEPQRLAHLTALAAAPWDAARQEGELQRRLAGRVVARLTKPLPVAPRVAGADVSYDKHSNRLFAAVVLL
ncbi:MAG: hypothetical protein N2483_10395, partial [Burkholderiaceae bacterium]|nr:hypothetical protein [Burkholderiaceae bacterium]